MRKVVTSLGIADVDNRLSIKVGSGKKLLFPLDCLICSCQVAYQLISPEGGVEGVQLCFLKIL